MTLLSTESKKHYVSPGMPALKLGKTTSFFEFWPTWLMYIPVVIQWIILSLKYRSLTLPLIANPTLPLSGMVGVPKSTLLAQATGQAADAILDWFLFERPDDVNQQNIDHIEQQMATRQMEFPIVCKPDIGCRGVGVKLVKNREQLASCLSNFPVGASIMIQRLADFEPEAGIFYTRHPNSTEGTIISMALKYMPYVMGDGKNTLSELVASDERAGELVHLYQQRHQEFWHTVIPKDQPYRLIFAASHSRGAIFKDAKESVTLELSQSLDNLLKQIPDFHYGRLDIKFKDFASLKRGEDLQIIEINTASSESLHIWDSNTRFREAIRSLLLQYRLLFSMGAANRIKGHRPPGIRMLLKHWKLERTLTKDYPETD